MSDSVTIHKQYMQFFIRSLLELPSTSLSDGWKFTPIYDCSCGGFSKLSIHASVLEPGVLPHEVHSHHDEEIFFITSGSLEVITEIRGQEESRINPIIKKHGFVYHSKEFEHTLRTSGLSEAHYLVVRWNRIEPITAETSPLCEIVSHPFTFPANTIGHQIHPIKGLQIKTNNRVRAHYSQMPPGAGYDLHIDHYDVLMILFEGSVEVIGQEITAPSVAFFASGFPHGLRNTGNTPANYFVIEMED